MSDLTTEKSLLLSDKQYLQSEIRNLEMKFDEKARENERNECAKFALESKVRDPQLISFHCCHVVCSLFEITLLSLLLTYHSSLEPSLPTSFSPYYRSSFLITFQTFLSPSFSLFIIHTHKLPSPLHTHTHTHTHTHKLPPPPHTHTHTHTHTHR